MNMLTRTLLLLIAVLSPSLAVAADDTEQLCNAGGYYAGAEDRFLSGVAAHILSQRGELGTSTCGALWKNASRVGEYFSKTGKPKPADSKVFEAAGDFSRRIYSAIAKEAGY
jgi:hypothetical protein